MTTEQRHNIKVTVLKANDNAIHVTDRRKKAWLPTGVFKTDDKIEVGKVITISIPERLGNSQGFV